MEKGTKKKFSFWRLLRNLVIGFAAAICITAMGSQDSSGALDPHYFDAIYRVDGVDYYLTYRRYLNRFHWDEFWQYGEDEDTLIHRFPMWVNPNWSEEHKAFFYMRGGKLYRWDILADKAVRAIEHKRMHNYYVWSVGENHVLLQNYDREIARLDLETGEIVMLREATGQSCSGLENYVLYYGYEKPVIIVDSRTGQEVDRLEFSAYATEVRGIKGDQVLFTVNNRLEDDLLYLYDAENGELTLLNPEDQGDDKHSYDIARAIFTTRGVAWVKCIEGTTYEQVYQLDLTTKELIVSELPSCEQIRAFVAGEDYLICAEMTPSKELTGIDRVLTYYQITDEGEVHVLYDWQPFSLHALNTCHVICDGELVVSGCRGEPKRISFTVE